jgi:drug/metabolite transporter (DMT)-like permease
MRFRTVQEKDLFTLLSIVFMMKKMATLNVIILVLASVVLGAFGQLSLKKGLKDKPIQISDLASTKLISTIFEPYVFLGALLYIAATLIWLVVLSNAELSYAYPLIGLGYIITTVFAFLYLGEQVALVRWLGVILIVIGAVLVGRS